jgi:hypothetical protein
MKITDLAKRIDKRAIRIEKAIVYLQKKFSDPELNEALKLFQDQDNDFRELLKSSAFENQMFWNMYQLKKEKNNVLKIPKTNNINTSSYSSWNYKY